MPPVSRREAAELLIVGVPGKTLEPETRALLADLEPGGVILLPRNIEEENQLAELVRALREVLPSALFCLDAEGGRVDRLRKVVAPAPAGQRLAAAPPALARRAGRAVGAALRATGFDVDLAPVVDLDHGKLRNALDERYLGRSPRAVVARARAFLAGLAAAGVGGCLKHFPGLGAAGEDTHDVGSQVDLAARSLERELVPFERLGEVAGAIMASHASYPALDTSGRPATLSKEISTHLLRDRLGFSGLLVSDDLDMHALDVWGDLAERAEMSLVAGCDALCVCHSLGEAPEIAERLAKGSLGYRRREAQARLAAYRAHVRRLADRHPKVLVEEARALLRELETPGTG